MTWQDDQGSSFSEAVLCMDPISMGIHWEAGTGGTKAIGICWRQFGKPSRRVQGKFVD